jgi:hypothetical protein
MWQAWLAAMQLPRQDVNRWKPSFSVYAALMWLSAATAAPKNSPR